MWRRFKSHEIIVLELPDPHGLKKSNLENFFEKCEQKIFEFFKKIIQFFFESVRVGGALKRLFHDF